MDNFHRATISSDGKVIAFQRDGLWVINSDGSNQRRLISPEQFKSMEPIQPGVGLLEFKWIPGTHKLLFNTRLLNGYGMFFTDDLYIADAETMQWAALFRPKEGGIFRISPDGQRVVMVTPRKITLLNVNGSGYRVLFEYPQVPVPSEYDYYAQPVWATDSQSLIVAIPPQDYHYGATLPTVIWRLYVDGKSPIVIKKYPANERLEISPDFSKIVFFRAAIQDSANPVYEMHISNFDGSGDIVYPIGKAVFEGWTPDSNHFVFRLDETRSYYIGKVGADLELLTESNIVFSPLEWVDGSHFLYLGSNNQQCVLVLGTVGEPGIVVASETTLNCEIYYDWVK